MGVTSLLDISFTQKVQVGLFVCRFLLCFFSSCNNEVRKIDSYPDYGTDFLCTGGPQIL